MVDVKEKELSGLILTQPVSSLTDHGKNTTVHTHLLYLPHFTFYHS